MTGRRILTVGIAGFGNVGKALAESLAGEAIPGVSLSAITARNMERAAADAASLSPAPAVIPLEELVQRVDVVVECATGEAFPSIARAALEAGKHLICVSAGGIPAFPDLEDVALRHGGSVQIATGAFPGFDAIRVAAEGNIRSVRHMSRQKPESVAHEQYVLDQGFDFARMPPSEPIRVFSGTAREAAANFPRHFNVAVSLSLAGIGFDRTSVEVWVDPAVTGAIHSVEVESDVSALSLTIRNIPSANPRTSRAVVPSILAALRGLVAPVRVGS